MAMQATKCKSQCSSQANSRHDRRAQFGQSQWQHQQSYMAMTLYFIVDPHHKIILVWGTSPFTRKEGSGNITILVLCQWNVVNVIFTTLWTATQVAAN